MVTQEIDQELDVICVRKLNAAKPKKKIVVHCVLLIYAINYYTEIIRVTPLTDLITTNLLRREKRRNTPQQMICCFKILLLLAMSHGILLFVATHLIIREESLFKRYQKTTTTQSYPLWLISTDLPAPKSRKSALFRDVQLLLLYFCPNPIALKRASCCAPQSVRLKTKIVVVVVVVVRLV